MRMHIWICAQSSFRRHQPQRKTEETRRGHEWSAKKRYVARMASASYEYIYLYSYALCSRPSPLCLDQRSRVHAKRIARCHDMTLVIRTVVVVVVLGLWVAWFCWFCLYARSGLWLCVSLMSHGEKVLSAERTSRMVGKVMWYEFVCARGAENQSWRSLVLFCFTAKALLGFSTPNPSLSAANPNASRSKQKLKTATECLGCLAGVFSQRIAAVVT